MRPTRNWISTGVTASLFSLCAFDVHFGVNLEEADKRLTLEQCCPACFPLMPLKYMPLKSLGSLLGCGIRRLTKKPVLNNWVGRREGVEDKKTPFHFFFLNEGKPSALELLNFYNVFDYWILVSELDFIVAKAIVVKLYFTGNSCDFFQTNSSKIHQLQCVFTMTTFPAETWERNQWRLGDIT